MIEAGKENMVLEEVSYIYYLIWFKKYKIKALINFGSEINTMSSKYVLKLGFKVHFINVKAQKIDHSILEMFEMILASF